MQDKEDRMKEERWQDCLRIMDDIVSACILDFNVLHAGKLKSGSALVRRLIELLGTTDFPLNDDCYMNKVVRMLAEEQERLAIRKEQELSQAEFRRLRRLRLVGVITADEEHHPDGHKKKRFKAPNLSIEVDKIRLMESSIGRDSEDVKKIIASLQGKSVEERSSIIRKMSSLQHNKIAVPPGKHTYLAMLEQINTIEFPMYDRDELVNGKWDDDYITPRVNPREHPLLKEFDACRTAKGLYEIAGEMIIPS